MNIIKRIGRLFKAENAVQSLCFDDLQSLEKYSAKERQDILFNNQWMTIDEKMLLMKQWSQHIKKGDEDELHTHALLFYNCVQDTKRRRIADHIKFKEMLRLLHYLENNKASPITISMVYDQAMQYYEGAHYGDVVEALCKFRYKDKVSSTLRVIRRIFDLHKGKRKFPKTETTYFAQLYSCSIDFRIRDMVFEEFLLFIQAYQDVYKKSDENRRITEFLEKIPTNCKHRIILENMISVKQ